jgi:hypothetical protein
VFVRLSRQQSPLSVLIIILLGVVLWLPGFFIPQFVPKEVAMPIWQLVSPFAQDYPVLSRIFGLVLLLAEAFIFNLILQQHQLLNKKSWLPALLFVVLGSCTPELLQLTPELLALLLLLPVMYLLLQTYRMEKAYGHAFNIGVLIALASLIHLPSIVFLVFALVALTIFRPFIWREWLILLFGLLIPYIYVSAWFFWKDQLSAFYQNQLIEPILQRDFFLKLPAIDYALTLVLGILLLAATGRFITGSGTATLKTRKGISMMIWFLVIALPAVLLAQHFGVMVFLFTLPPLAFLIANYFLQAQRIWLAELLFALLLLGILMGYKIYM